MLHDAKYFHAPDPFLADAMQASVEVTCVESQEIAGYMRAAEKEHDFIPLGTPLQFQGDEEAINYIPSDVCEKTGVLVRHYGTSLIQQLGQAASLEEQKNILLNGMREAVDFSMLNHGHPQQAVTMIATIEHVFEEYSKANKHCSREVLDMRHVIKFYATLALDSLACTQALTENLQRQQSCAPLHMVATPHSLAWIRDKQRRPTVVSADPANSGDNSDYSKDARLILMQLVEPYHGVLPQTISVDMLGLILRCTEGVADQELRYAARRTRAYDNDNAPTYPDSLLSDPLIRRKVCSILGEVMLKHPDAAVSPAAMIDAAQALEEALHNEAVRNKQLGIG